MSWQGPESNPGQKAGWRPYRWLLAAIGVVLVTTVVASPWSDDVGDEGTALVMCEDFVRERLRAPSTAEFGPSHEARVQPTADDRWFVRSHVDAQNGFGAMIRSEWSCDARYVGEDEWRLSAEILD